MFKRFFTPPEKSSYFLFGPRGTGKTTWLKAHYPDAYWVDLLDPEVFRFFAAAPEKLKQIVEENQPEKKVIVIDEVQKVPEILNVVHGLIEKKQGLQFVLTGSSARKLKRDGVNLLAGRALLKHMPPFFSGELGSSFELQKHLQLGLLPIVLNSPEPKDVLKAYAGVYLKEEVQSEGIVRNVGDFARFLETMSFSHASLLNTSNIARECQTARKTVDSYLHILEDLLLSFRLDVFRTKAKRALSDHSKFYFFDSGVFLSLKPQHVFDSATELEGGSLEGMVAQHLRAWQEAQIDPVQLSFWRTTSQLEVDFIVSGPDCFLAIEVKNGAHVHPADLKSLEAFCSDYPEATPILLYRGKHKYKERGILCYPVDEYLLQIHPYKKLP